VSDYQPWSKCQARRRREARAIAEAWCERFDVDLDSLRSRWARDFDATRHRFMLVTHLRNSGFSFNVIGEVIGYTGQSVGRFYEQARAIGIR
jgi:hypothetical protein